MKKKELHEIMNHFKSDAEWLYQYNNPMDSIALFKKLNIEDREALILEVIAQKDRDITNVTKWLLERFSPELFNLISGKLEKLRQETEMIEKKQEKKMEGLRKKSLPAKPMEKPTVEPLVKALKDKDENVREKVKRALVKLGIFDICFDRKKTFLDGKNKEIKYHLAEKPAEALEKQAKEWINNQMPREITVEHPKTGAKVKVPILAQFYDVSSASEAWQLALRIIKKAEAKGVKVFVASGEIQEKKSQTINCVHDEIQKQVENYYKKKKTEPIILIVTGLDPGLNIAEMKQNQLYAVGLKSIGFYDYTTGKRVTGSLSTTDYLNPHRAYLAGEHEAWVNPLTDPLILESERKKFSKVYTKNSSKERIQEFLVELTKNIEARKIEAIRRKLNKSSIKKY